MPFSLRSGAFLGVAAHKLFTDVNEGSMGGSSRVHETQGWPLWMNALVFGLASSSSLPIGAAFGIYYSPASKQTVASMLAFGAGCLLFAVTVELYGEALAELEEDGFVDGSWSIVTTVVAAIIGAYGYIRINRWMDHVMDHEFVHDAPPEGGPETPVEGTPRDGESHEVNRGKMWRQSTNQVMSDQLSLAKKKMKKIWKVASGAKGKFPKSARNKVLMRAVADAEATETDEEKEEHQKGFKLAVAMWLGVLVDGIPESILLGFLAAEMKLSIALVVSLFIANFPEGFSAASLMREAHVPKWKIMAMWISLFLMTGVLAGFACWCLPADGQGFHSGDNFYLHFFGAVVEGLAGGAMLACIASVMLPEAFEMEGDIIGLIVVVGFLLTVMVKVFGGYASELTGGKTRGESLMSLAHFIEQNRKWMRI